MATSDSDNGDCPYCSYLSKFGVGSDYVDRMDPPWTMAEPCRLCRVQRLSQATLLAARQRQSTGVLHERQNVAHSRPMENPLPEPVMATNFDTAFDSFHQFMSFASKQCGRYHGNMVSQEQSHGNDECMGRTQHGENVPTAGGAGQRGEEVTTAHVHVAGPRSTRQSHQRRARPVRTADRPVPVISEAKTGDARTCLAMHDKDGAARHPLRQHHAVNPRRPAGWNPRRQTGNQSHQHQNCSHCGHCPASPSRSTTTPAPAQSSSAARHHYAQYHSQRQGNPRHQGNPLNACGSGGGVQVQVEPGTYAVTAARWGQEGRRNDTHIVNLEKEQCVQLTFAL
ncbi:uncharacterized protein LOC135820699 [Sycon ciliatum]|uniref:uncharacterized protein LOC135820699 n=1 Tax=Sycon ciliatum TaxID=27933 RepID=UPI0031F61FF3